MEICKPIDKRTNLCKRCVELLVITCKLKKRLLINGKELILPERARPQYSYKVALGADKQNIDSLNICLKI
jgi:signal peptidase I